MNNPYTDLIEIVYQFSKSNKPAVKELASHYSSKSFFEVINEDKINEADEIYFETFTRQQCLFTNLLLFKTSKYTALEYEVKQLFKEYLYNNIVNGEFIISLWD